jgi:2'-5' RNA ligase
MFKKIIKEKLNSFLMEGHKREFGCVMLDIDVDKTKWNKLIESIDESDLYEGESKKDKGEFGVEKQQHITILFGLHSSVKDSEVNEILDKIETIDFDLTKISIFETDEFDVLKYDVVSSDLKKWNKELSKLDNTNEFDYHPHATIAYLKKGSGKKYIQTLKMEAKPERLHYSKTDGTDKFYPIKKHE